MIDPVRLSPLHVGIRRELERLSTERNERGASELLLVISMRLPQLMKDHLEQIQDMLNELEFIDNPEHRTLWYRDILRFILFPNAKSEEDESEEGNLCDVASVSTLEADEGDRKAPPSPVVEDTRLKNIDLSSRLLN